MLSAVVTNENLIETLFIDDERTLIDVVYRSEDNLIKSYTVDVDPDNIDFQYLLEITNLDEIEEFTAKAIEAEYQAIEEFQKHILAKQSEEPSDNRIRLSMGQAIDFFVNYKSGEKITKLNMTQEELLFNMKIYLFDLPEVENADDNFKELIRNADTPFGLLNTIHDFINQS